MPHPAYILAVLVIPKSCFEQVRVRWWGENGYGTLLRPASCTGQGPTLSSSVYYAIKCSWPRILQYLSDARFLNLDIVDESTHLIIAKARIVLGAAKDLRLSHGEHDCLRSSSGLSATLHDGPVPMYTEDGTKVGEVCAAMDIRFKTQPQRTSFEQSELLADTDPGLLLYPLGFGEDPLRPRPGLADRPGVAWPGDGTSRSALSDADLSLLSAIQEASNESHPTALSLSCAHRTKNDGTGGVSLLGGSTVSEEVFTPGAAPPWTPGASAGRPQQAGRSAATPQAAAASLPRRARTLMQESDDEVAARVMRMLNEDCAEDMPFDGGGSGSGAGGGSASAPGGIASRCRGSAETVPERRVAADDADVRASAARRARIAGSSVGPSTPLFQA